MPRPRTIDREHLLDVAEALLAESGVASLSFGGLAAAAGLSKASVQSVFTTREGLIEAIMERWLQREQSRFDRAAGPAPGPRERVRAHLLTTAAEPAESNSRVAGLLAVLASKGGQVDSAARWYASRIGDFSARSAEEKRARIAFLAAEGAFYVRHLAGVPMTDRLWKEIFRELLRFEAEG